MKLKDKVAVITGGSLGIGFAYPAPKFAVNGLNNSLARGLGHKGIRVNAGAPASRRPT